MSFLAVFDVDGTLVDSQHHIGAAMDHAHDAAGLERLPHARVLEIVGLSLPEAFAHLHPNLDESSRAALVAGYKDAFSAVRTRMGEAGAPLYPGVAEGLERLGAMPDLLIGAATGKSRRGLDSVFDTHDLRRHFVTAQCADDHPSKPHPGMLLAALAETGSEADRAAMIGDTEFDIAMGRAAGMATIGVTWGYHGADRLQAAGADHLAEDFAGLEALILELAQ
ncbi:HAD-IA family hydrolase [Frigidibacter sp. ROC022]|uniref:HAD-IA family hydrolase n=1 Tax=Frigidibacter sp. ROC022 TaxID=2971796 RepID=UPI00215B1FF7|nr:HAD-IA family hydrolase [Frigidibacter sp. ROC022]MCR8726583.1 HAD-IA family hydrolase [Frigidibacter sp. ROC022]